MKNGDAGQREAQVAVLTAEWIPQVPLILPRPGNDATLLSADSPQNGPFPNQPHLPTIAEAETPATTKITAIHSGGDWFDASAKYIVLPPDIDIEKEVKKWHEWYQDTWDRKEQIKYHTLCEWLIHRGARYSTDDELEILKNSNWTEPPI